MGAIRTNAAAAMLGVSPNTLRSWERRFGYPEPRRTAGDEVTVYDFRGALPSSGPTTVPRLGDSALAATERLLQGPGPRRVPESERRLLAVGARG